MNLKRKIKNWVVAASISISGLFSMTSIYADYDHHWHHDGGYHHGHYYHHHDGGAIAAGIVGSAIAGIMIGSAISHSDNYNYDCREVYYTHNCEYDSFGDERCYTVKHVHYSC